MNYLFKDYAHISSQSELEVENNESNVIFILKKYYIHIIDDK